MSTWNCASSEVSSIGQESDTESDTHVDTKPPACRWIGGSGLLRRNVSMPSMCGGDDGKDILPRNKSFDDRLDCDDEGIDSMLIEVDGKVVLAPQSERLVGLKSNPYVGNFHYGHEASEKLSGRKNSPPQEPQAGSCAEPHHSDLQKSPMICSDADSSAVPTPNPFLQASEDDDCSSPLGSPLARMRPDAFGYEVKHISLADSKRREKMKKALQLNASVPADPEMCGLQALLPRQSGIQVMHSVGEGAFGKCVKVLNRKNQKTWSKTASKRGIERHLFETPKEGDSLVVKYVRKDDHTEDAQTADHSASCPPESVIQREIRIHGKCHHPNIVRLFGHYELGDKIALLLGFIQGAELNDLLHLQRTLPEPDSFVVMLQLLRATEVVFVRVLAALHRKGLCTWCKSCETCACARHRGASMQARGASMQARGASMQARGASMQARGASMQARGASMQANTKVQRGRGNCRRIR
jgi:hypothetical protein